LSDLAALHAVLAGLSPDFGGDAAEWLDLRVESVSEPDAFVVPDVDATPARLLRVTAVAWADAALDQLASTEVTDSLTGLPTSAYLRTRLGEVYRQAARRDRQPAEDHTLLVVSADFSSLGGWSRLSCMILIADVLRTVFDAGESAACLGPSVVAVLVARDGEIASHAVLLRRKLTERLSLDPQLHELTQPRIQLVRLPSTHDAATRLLTQLGRC
jgi:GGDEF domain-containing protein